MQGQVYVAGRMASPSGVWSAVRKVNVPLSELIVVPAMPVTNSRVPLLLLIIWGCGFLVVAVTRLRSWVRIRSLVSEIVPIESPRLESPWRNSPVSAFAPGMMEPCVAGSFSVLFMLLPEGIADRLTEPQLEAVLAHELAHVRRHDNLWASLHMVVEAVYWFHPLVWWIGARLEAGTRAPRL